mgnify:CR=1 FL=1
MTGSKKHLIPQARALYARGLSIAGVARALGVGETTVYRWRNADRDAGLPWSALQGPSGPAELLLVVAGLQRLLARVVQADDVDVLEQVRAVNRIHRALEQERQRLAMFEGRAVILQRMEAWATAELTPADAGRVQEAIRLYLNSWQRELLQPEAQDEGC